MDGTLTLPRKQIDWTTVVALRGMQEYADIGIVSGSPYEYIKQQMSMAWSEINSMNPRKLKIMPCNGTSVYEFTKSKEIRPGFVQTYSADMIDYLGKENYRILISILTDLQNQVIEANSTMPISGNFISFRRSMVNWCMIGRDADHSMREAFKSMDDNLRLRLKSQLDDQLSVAKINNISTALGGSTSIDIYPEGWDKTYCLQHLDNDARIYFIGDKCKPGGNDYELFKTKRTISYETTGPDETLQIIKRIKAELIHGKH